MGRIIPGIILLLCLSAIPAAGQTYTAPGSIISDNGPEAVIPINVSGLAQSTLGTAYGLESVCINVTHPSLSDLVIRLRAPDGTIVRLAVNTGYDGDNFTNTCFTGNGPSIATDYAPFTGAYQPYGILGRVNNGQNGNGTWQLLVQDVYGGNYGHVSNVTLKFSTNPAQPITPAAGNLPVVVLQTNGNIIKEEPKTTVRMGIIDNGPGVPNHPSDPWNNYDGWAGIEFRGVSSRHYPQRSYTLETRDIQGNEANAALAGMPAEHNWTLISSFNDKTLLRNALTYEMGRRMGRWAPRTRFCEVMLDGEYMGIYLLAEKIKRDANRVDIAKLEPHETSGDDLTGGYILKIDNLDDYSGPYFESGYKADSGTGTQSILFQNVYPKHEDIAPEQKTYIRKYVDSFETALAGGNFSDLQNGYRHFADAASFIDYFLLSELSYNVDAYRQSFYLYKDKDSKGGRLTAGPLWDFNLAWWNADYCGGDRDTGWAYLFGKECPQHEKQVPYWWRKMLEDGAYSNELKCRWNELRQGPLSSQHIYQYIDSTAALLQVRQATHFTRWNIMGYKVFSNPAPVANSYAEEVNRLKNWIAQRLAWLDAKLPGNCFPASVAAGTTNGFTVYPNPFRDEISLALTAVATETIEITLLSSLGQIVYRSSQRLYTGRNTIRLSTGPLGNGVYFLCVNGSHTHHRQVLIKEER